MLVLSKENEAPWCPPHKIAMQMINGHFLGEKELSYSIFMSMVHRMYFRNRESLIGKLFRNVGMNKRTNEWSKTADNNLLVYSMKCR